MPRYSYRCDACSSKYLVMHSSDEILEECEKCNRSGFLIKLVPRPLYKIKKPARPRKTGQITEEFIDESRQELHQQKSDLEKNR